MRLAGVAGTIGAEAAKRLTPGMTGRLVRDILERAIDGVGPVPGAASAADNKLRKAGGVTEAAIEALINRHVRLAAAQGFLTNVGGLITVAAAIPANIAGVALLQCHLAATIAHLRGYDLDKPAVRDAILVCLLDKGARKYLTKDTGLTITPIALISEEVHPELRDQIGRAVSGQLLAQVGGKRTVTFVARHIPVLGGAVGGFGDAMATRRIGRDTAKLPPASGRNAAPIDALPFALPGGVVLPMALGDGAARPDAPPTTLTKARAIRPRQP